MKSGPWIVTVLAIALAAFAWLTRPADQSAELARLQARSDSLAARTARVDTVYRADTVRLWRTIASYDTVRTRDTLMRNDTVFVPRAVADAVVAECRATILTCERRVALRDSTIAVRDSVDRVRVRQLRAERGKRVRDALAGAGVGVLAGLLWRR